MAFHPHLIDPLWDHIPATAQRLRRKLEPSPSAKSRLSLQLHLRDCGRLQSRRTHGCD